jgi:hypothetical protein
MLASSVGWILVASAPSTCVRTKAMFDREGNLWVGDNFTISCKGKIGQQGLISMRS